MNNRKVCLEYLASWRTAITDSDLEPNTRFILLTLSLHMNEAGESAFPSQELLAAETGLSVRRVRDHVLRALYAGWIDGGLVEEKRKGGNHYAYTARFPKELDVPSSIDSKIEGGDAASEPYAEADEELAERGMEAGRHGRQ